MPNCIRCGLELTRDNASREHIIPNGVAGSLESFAVVCETNKCNSKYGDSIDAALVNQLMPFVNALDLDRDRGRAAPVTVTLESGERFRREPNGKLIPFDSKPIVTARDETSVSFRISTATTAQARKHLTGLKRKYPKLDVEAVMATVRQSITPIAGKTTFEIPIFGGSEAFRAVIKIAVGYYLHLGGDSALIHEAIEAVNNEQVPPLSRVGCLYSIDPLPNRDNSRVHHVLGLASSQGVLRAYVELLSAFRFVVVLADDYSGPPISAAYAWDVIHREELELDVATLGGLWIPEDPTREALDRAFAPVMEVAGERSKARSPWGEVVSDLGDTPVAG